MSSQVETSKVLLLQLFYFAIGTSKDCKLYVKVKIMELQSLLNAPAKTEEEYKQEANRLIAEIEVMQIETQRMSEESQRIADRNRQSRQHLRELLLCGNK